MTQLSGTTARRWTVRAIVRDLPLLERFTIARESWDSATTLFVVVGYGDTYGIGEVQPDERWDGALDDVVASIERVDPASFGHPFDLEGNCGLLPAGAARCALDIALHDLAAKLAGVSVAELLGLGGRPLPETSVTVPITDVSKMVERAQSFAGHPILKLKVGFDGDVEAVRAIREVFGGRIRIDANEGWTRDQATDRLLALAELDIELCEQPMHSEQHDDLRAVTAASPIPIFADEDVFSAADVVRLHGIVHGVNLKLRKTGGLREAVRAIATARSLGMGVMLGCDLESGVAATAEASLASLVDFADLDGPLLLKEDPWPGVVYERGTMTLPAGPGLGVKGDVAHA
ncbi:MAG TPA: dipeptide epimerase [Actinomycetota bacterium]|jgi:L-alanine-DL-glutamate epimerase-like enolase superfamily enzyme